MISPQLASTQLNFSALDATKDLANAPSHTYTIQVFLRAREGSNFSTVAYTEQIKHFLGVCISGDSEFTILKKRKEARINAITRQDEVPSNTFEFEQDFAREMQIDKNNKWIRFRISVTSSKSFQNLFRQDNVSTTKLIKKYRWFVDKCSLEHDCYTVHIGWFKHLHPVFTNRADFRTDFDYYFKDIIQEYEFTSRYERRTYTTVNDDGSEKKESCNIRVISMYVPADIARDASQRIVEFWGNELNAAKAASPLLGQPRNRLHLCEFIPNSSKLLQTEDQIQHLLQHGLYLNQNKDAILMYNCSTLKDKITCSEELSRIAMAPQLQGTDTTLEEIFYSWVETNTTHRIINSIEKMTNDRFALLVHGERLQEVRQVLLDIFDTLRQEMGEEFSLLGGNKKDGIRIDDTLGMNQPVRAKSYLDSLKHKHHYVRVSTQAPSQSTSKTCAVTDHTNMQVQRLYSDVLTTTASSNNKAPSTTTSLVLKSKDGANSQITTMEDFQKIVQHQFQQMLAPTLTQLQETVTKVNDASARVDILENTTLQVQKEMKDMTSTITTMGDLTKTVNTNMTAMRVENESQFSQILALLQAQQSASLPPSSNTPQTFITASTQASHLSSLTSAQSSQIPASNIPASHIPASKASSIPTNQNPYTQTSKKSKIDTTTDDPLDEDMLDAAFASMEDTPPPASRSRKPSSGSISQSPSFSMEENEEGQEQ